jgi:hypothetical protein
MSSNNNHHTGHDACASGILRNTMKTFPIAIPPTPQAAPSRAAGLILRAVESLQPLTKPRRGRPCSSATAIADVLQDCIQRLATLQIVPTPPPRHVLRSPRIKKGKHDLEYAGVAWSAARLLALRKLIDETEELPISEIIQWVVDHVASDRCWTVARLYLSGLHGAST